LLKVGQDGRTGCAQTRLGDLGYQPADTVLEPGQFSHRGGILDMWTPSDETRRRLSFLVMKSIPSAPLTRLLSARRAPERTADYPGARGAAW
jgi:excinuclease UvrABC helicase subunit UvrB